MSLLAFYFTYWWLGNVSRCYKGIDKNNLMHTPIICTTIKNCDAIYRESLNILFMQEISISFMAWECSVSSPLKASRWKAFICLKCYNCFHTTIEWSVYLTVTDSSFYSCWSKHPNKNSKGFRYSETASSMLDPK